MKYRLVPIFFAFVAIFILSNRSTWREYSVIGWDASGYYSYLPSVFLYHDLGQLGKTDSVRYHYACDFLGYGLYSYQNTGRRVNKYPLGVAVMEMPFFLVTNYLICPATRYPVDGFSIPYQLGVALSTVFWACFGLYFLGMLLRRYYSDTDVMITLLILAFGTNLYFCTAFTTGWSHPFSFFLLACLMYCTDTWKKGSLNSLPVIGFLLGMLIITRPTNMVGLLIPLFWPSQNKIGTTRSANSKALAALFCVLLFLDVCFLQMSYWRYTTGQWICYSYRDEGFDFMHPHIFEALCGYSKGWFVYTPAALIIICSIPLLWQQSKQLALLCCLLLPVYVYVVYSWWMWYYPGAFSSRPMVDILPVLSLPLAALVSVVRKKKMVLKGTVYSVFAVLIILNLFQTYQYSIGVIRENTNKEYYWRVFGRIKATDDDRKLLLIRH